MLILSSTSEFAYSVLFPPKSDVVFLLSLIKRSDI